LAVDWIIGLVWVDSSLSLALMDFFGEETEDKKV
jgi:hypothetical protein